MNNIYKIDEYEEGRCSIKDTYFIGEDGKKYKRTECETDNNFICEKCSFNPSFTGGIEIVK